MKNDRVRPLDPWPGERFDLEAIARAGHPALCDLARRMYAEAGRYDTELDELPEWMGTGPMMARWGEHGGSYEPEDEDLRARVLEEQRRMQRAYKAAWREKKKQWTPPTSS